MYLFLNTILAQYHHRNNHPNRCATGLFWFPPTIPSPAAGWICKPTSWHWWVDDLEFVTISFLFACSCAGSTQWTKLEKVKDATKITNSVGQTMVTLREKKHIVGGSPSPSAVSMPTCNRASRQDASSKPKIVHMYVCTYKNIPLQNMFEDPFVQTCVRISHCNTMWLTLWPDSTFMTLWSNMAIAPLSTVIQCFCFFHSAPRHHSDARHIV